MENYEDYKEMTVTVPMGRYEELIVAEQKLRILEEFVKIDKPYRSDLYNAVIGRAVIEKEEE